MKSKLYTLPMFLPWTNTPRIENVSKIFMLRKFVDKCYGEDFDVWGFIAQKMEQLGPFGAFRWFISFVRPYYFVIFMLVFRDAWLFYFMILCYFTIFLLFRDSWIFSGFSCLFAIFWYFLFNSQVCVLHLSFSKKYILNK